MNFLVRVPVFSFEGETVYSENVSIKEAAAFLQFSEQYVRKLVRDGRLPADRIGNTWILPWDAVLRYEGKEELVSKAVIDHPRRQTNRGEIKCLSFFSGAMGLDLGLEKAGITTYLACEVDKASRKTIESNRPNMALIGDIRDYSSEHILVAAGLERGEVDLMVGGPPCQAFSSAGKRQGFNDERGNVFLTFIDRILDIKPRFAIIENVRGLLSAALTHIPHQERTSPNYVMSTEEVRGSALLHILKKLRGAGYGVSFNLYNSANFGSPQKRERVILVCSRDGIELPYLTPTHSENGEYGLPKWRSLQKAIKGLENVDHSYVKFPEKRLRFYRLLKDGQNWRNLPQNLQKEALGNSYYAGGGKTGFLRRLAWDKPSPTLVTHPAMPATDLCHPEKLRPLSVQEYKRIQEFPDKWKIEGGKIAQYKQIGNAVPVSLGAAVGRLIVNAINDEIEMPPPDFNFSRYKNTTHLEWESTVINLYDKFTSKLPEQTDLPVA